MKAADRRPLFRQGLSPLYLPFFDALCSKLGPEWQPYSGTRNFQEQTQLYAQGRTQGMIGVQYIVTNARAGETPHNYGSATDWTWFEGETLKWLKKDDPKWKEYIDAVCAVGLRSGVSFGDPDHNELNISRSWREVALEYQTVGMAGAQAYIARIATGLIPVA